MSPDQLLAFSAFAFVSSITPGPNNMMLLASGVNFGLRRSLPHMLGITLGFVFLVLCIGLGLHQLFSALPWLQTLLRYLGAAYLTYLAWQIARAGQPQGQNSARSQPFSFLQAAAFQWVNPKAWIMGLGAITTYAPAEHFASHVLLIAALFGLINLPSVGVWTLAGTALRPWLERPRALRAFNISMALLLLASLYPILC